eukprot:11115121-Lingulodinium_polyedra.AAC.1
MAPWRSKVLSEAFRFRHRARGAHPPHSLRQRPWMQPGVRGGPRAPLGRPCTRGGLVGRVRPRGGRLH